MIEFIATEDKDGLVILAVESTEAQLQPPSQGAPNDQSTED